MTTRRGAIVVVLALAAHVTALGNGFVFDDAKAVIANPSVVGPLSGRRLLHGDFWGRDRSDPESVGTWRPLPTLSFWLDWHGGGGRPWPFHLVNLVLHALAALALALALERATGDATLGCVAAGLWSVLAVGSEAVASVVGRADLMATLFGFVGFWLWRARRTPTAALAAYFAGCLCKESAVIMPAWWFALDLLLVPPSARRPARDWLLLVCTGLAYAGLRTSLFAPFSKVQLGLNNNPLLGAPWPVRLWTGMRLLVLALRVIVVPLNLSADYSGFEIVPERTLSWEPLLGALVLLLCLVGVVRLSGRAPAVAAGLALFVIAWSVVSNIVVLLPTIFAERLLYLPAAGLALAVAAAAANRPRLRLVVVPLMVANLGLCVVADRMWHDDLHLFAATVEVSPKSPRAWLNYAVQLRRAGDKVAAEAAFTQSLRLGPSAEAYSGLGALLDEGGRPAEAERALLTALRYKPDDRPATQNAAIFYARHARYAQAIDVVAPYVARHPDDRELSDLLAHLRRSNRPTSAARP